MKALVVGTPKFPVPPDQLPGMIDGALAWHERYKDHIEIFGSFPGGGGFATIDVPDEQTLNQMVIDMPFSWVSEVSIRIFVEGVAGLRQLQESLAAMSARG